MSATSMTSTTTTRFPAAQVTKTRLGWIRQARRTPRKSVQFILEIWEKGAKKKSDHDLISICKNFNLSVRIHNLSRKKNHMGRIKIISTKVLLEKIDLLNQSYNSMILELFAIPNPHLNFIQHYGYFSIYSQTSHKTFITFHSLNFQIESTISTFLCYQKN
jgi:hypothetical protein